MLRIFWDYFNCFSVELPLDISVAHARTIFMITNPNLRLLAAVLLMFMTIASFTMMAIAGRYVSDELDTFEIMMYRSLIGFILILSFTITTKRFHTIQIAFLRDHFLRNIFHFSAQNLWFYAITVIPLVQVFALEFTVPIWILILSPFFLGEVFTRPRAIAAILGFTGILIITRPDAETLNTGTIAAGLAALGFAGSIMLTKGLTRKQNTLSILLIMTVMQLVFGVLCAGYDFDIAGLSKTNYIWVITIGVAGLMAHLCLTTALSLAPTTVVSPIDFLRLPVIAIVGYLLFGETVDQYLVYGVVLICVGNYVNVLAERSGISRAT